MIGSASINLKQIIEDCSHIKKPLALNAQYYKEAMEEGMKTENKPVFETGETNKFWLKLMGRDANGKVDSTGEFRLQVNVLPILHAEKNPVGKAR